MGMAEIFPISPGGHSVLFESVLGWPKVSSTFSLSVQIGTLLGIMAYFWADLWDMAGGVARALKGKRDAGAVLAGQIVVATLPTLAIGFLLVRYVEIDDGSLAVIGWATIGGAILLFAFDYLSMTVKRVEHTTFLDAALISVMQVAALVPGVGRIVLAMTMARFLGYERTAVARFSLLLSIPVLAALIVRDAIELNVAQMVQITNAEIFAGVVAFAGGLFSVAVLMAWLTRSSFTPFVVYRLALGGMVLAIAYDVFPI